MEESPIMCPPGTGRLHQAMAMESRYVPTPKEGAVMKLLVAIRNRMSANQSLKSKAWYLWY
jgi:hypothetical protein